MWERKRGKEGKTRPGNDGTKPYVILRFPWQSSTVTNGSSLGHKATVMPQIQDQSLARDLWQLERCLPGETLFDVASLWFSAQLNENAEKPIFCTCTRRSGWGSQDIGFEQNLKGKKISVQQPNSRSQSDVSENDAILSRYPHETRTRTRPSLFPFLIWVNS